MLQAIQTAYDAVRRFLHPLVAAAGALTLAQINEIAGISASVVAILYTAWSYRRDKRRDETKQVQ